MSHYGLLKFANEKERIPGRTTIRPLVFYSKRHFTRRLGQHDRFYEELTRQN
jgi:hypothetical protein